MSLTPTREATMDLTKMSLPGLATVACSRAVQGKDYGDILAELIARDAEAKRGDARMELWGELVGACDTLGFWVNNVLDDPQCCLEYKLAVGEFLATLEKARKA